MKLFVYHLGFEKQKNKIEIHIKNYLMHGDAKVLYYVYIGNDDKVVLNSYIWITYSHILMLMFLQLVRSINCKRKKVTVSHLLIVKENVIVELYWITWELVASINCNSKKLWWNYIR